MKNPLHTQFGLLLVPNNRKHFSCQDCCAFLNFDEKVFIIDLTSTIMSDQCRVGICEQHEHLFAERRES